MISLMADQGLDFLTLVNQKGIVLMRFHNPGVSGDSLIEDPFVKEALNGKPVSGTQGVPREELLKEGKTLANKAVFFLIPTPKEKPAEKLEQTSGMLLRSSGSLDQVKQSIKALEKGERVRWRGADPIIRKKSAQDGDNKSIASLFQEHGLHFEPGAKGYSDRISTVVNMIHAGELSVSDNCPITQVAYQQYRWSDVSPSRATDAPERPHKKDDHPCDADQYLFTLFTPKNATIQPTLAPATNDEYIRAIVAEQTKRQRDRMRPRYR